MNQNKNSIYKEIKHIFLRWGFSKKGIFNNAKGEWYLFAQIFILILHLLPSYPKIINIPFSINILIIIAGLAFSSKGLIIVIMGLRDLGNNLTPLPYPINESIFIKKNSYKNTRHPIYKGILFISFGISVLSLSLMHLFLFISLAYILKSKARREEERLIIKFPEYKKYIGEVPAIIKGIKYLDWRL